MPEIEKNYTNLSEAERLQKWTINLMIYSFQIEYKPTKEGLSRLYLWKNETRHF